MIKRGHSNFLVISSNRNPISYWSGYEVSWVIKYSSVLILLREFVKRWRSVKRGQH